MQETRFGGVGWDLLRGSSTTRPRRFAYCQQLAGSVTLEA